MLKNEYEIKGKLTDYVRISYSNLKFGTNTDLLTSNKIAYCNLHIVNYKPKIEL